MRKWKEIYPAVEKAVAPGLRHSQYAYKDKLKAYAKPDFWWLDAGCGRGIFPEWMRRHDRDVLPPRVRLVGIDMDMPSLHDNTTVVHRVAGNMEQAPFRAGSFHLITSNAVMEHVADPAAALRNVHALLKANGLFIFHTPNFYNYQTLLASLLPQRAKNALSWHLEGRREEDVFPTHYRMNTAAKIRRLAKECGFQVRDLELVNSSPETLRLGPLVIFELIGIRILNWRIFKLYRSNIIAVLEKLPDAAAGE